jgi:hypothetical protein
MFDEQRFFFILGMPRARTAWLSVALTFGESVCLHEGVANCGTFAEYAAKLRSIPSRVVGDSDAALVYWLPALQEEFPDAAFVVVRRDHDAAKFSLMRAEPDQRDKIEQWWPGYCAQFEATVASLDCPQLDQMALNDAALLEALATRLTGASPPVGHFERLLEMNIQTQREGGITAPKALAPEMKIPREFLESRGVKLPAGMSVRYYAPQDYAAVSSWWEERHAEQLPHATLPPLGVVVELNGEMQAALWVYECYGVGVAYLEWPVTRPGLSGGEAGRAMNLAVAACMYLAGKRLEPVGWYSVFRTVTPYSAIARHLERIGFQRERGHGRGDGSRIALTYQIK